MEEQPNLPVTGAFRSNGGASSPKELKVSLELPEGARLRVTLEVLGSPDEQSPANRTVYESNAAGSGGGPVVISIPLSGNAAGRLAPPVDPVSTIGERRAWLSRVRPAAWPYSLGTVLFGLALLVYLATRLVGLVDWPVYFFTDEAVQTVLAADLVRDHFKGYEGDFLPTYFKNGTQYNLGTSVYLQVIPTLLFGKSVFVTRAVSVLAGLLAAGCVGLILREIFRSPYWWSGTLLLSITPAWFLHSRTAFETVLFVSFYSAFLFSYLLYRLRSPGYIYLCTGLAALAFYTYSPGQVVIGLTAFLLLLSDLSYHWKNRRLLLRALLLAALLAAPYLRFRLQHPSALTDHLKNLSSYWLQPLPLGEKLRLYAAAYLRGLSPAYWFIPNDHDLPRHLMRGYGHLLRWTLPFTGIGLALALRELRSPAYRSVFIALLAAPAGAALVGIGITRVLVLVIPAALLTALGVSRLLTWIESRRLPRPALSTALFAALALANLLMLRDALARGPTWYTDYGLGGLQYGARPLFAAIRETLQADPQVQMIVSPTWSNGTDVVARFFLPDPLPVQLGSIDGHLNERLPLDERTLFVMTPEEYEKARTSPKFTDLRVEKELPYPNGRTGFYFVRLRYAEDIDQILAAEQAARRALLAGQIYSYGQDVAVKYPHLDMGEVANAFDGDEDTVVRTLEANPAVFELAFSQPVELHGMRVKFGSTEIRLVVRLYPPGETRPREYSGLLQGSVEQPAGTIEFGAEALAQRLVIEIEDTRQGEPGHVHVWEIELLTGGQERR